MVLPPPPKRPPRNRLASNDSLLKSYSSSPPSTNQALLPADIPIVLPLRVKKKSSKDTVDSATAEEVEQDINLKNGASTSTNDGIRGRSREKASDPHAQNFVSLPPPLSAISQEASPLDPFFGPNSTNRSPPAAVQVDSDSDSKLPSKGSKVDSFVDPRRSSSSDQSGRMGVEPENSGALAPAGSRIEDTTSKLPQNRINEQDRPFILSPPSPETERSENTNQSASGEVQDESEGHESQGVANQESSDSVEGPSDLRKRRTPSPPLTSLSPSNSNIEIKQRRLSPSSLYSNSSGGARTIDATGGVPLHHSSAPLLSPAHGGRSPEGPREAIPQDVEESDGEFSMSSSNRGGGGEDSENESRRDSEDGNSSSFIDNRDSEEDKGDDDEDDLKLANVGLGLQSANTFNNGDISITGISSADRSASSDMLFSPPPSTFTPQFAVRKETKDRQPLELAQPPSKGVRKSHLPSEPSQTIQKTEGSTPTPPQSESTRRVQSVQVNVSDPLRDELSKGSNVSRPISQPEPQPQSQPTRNSRSSSTATSNSSQSPDQSVPHDPRSPADVPVTPFSDGNQSPKLEPDSTAPAVPRIPEGLILSPVSALLTGGTNSSTGQIRGSGLFGAMQSAINSPAQRMSKASRKSELGAGQVKEDREADDESKTSCTSRLPAAGSTDPQPPNTASSDLLSPQPNGNGSSSAGGSSSYKTVTPGVDVSSYSSSPPSSKGKEASFPSSLPFRSKDFSKDPVSSPNKDSEGFSSDFYNETDNELSPTGSTHSFSSNDSQQQNHGLNLRARRLRSRIERLEAAGKEVPAELNQSLSEIDTTLKIQKKKQADKKVPSTKEKRELVKDSDDVRKSSVNDSSKIDALGREEPDKKHQDASQINSQQLEDESREEVRDGNSSRNGTLGLRGRTTDASINGSNDNSSSRSGGFYQRRPGSSSSSSIRSGLSLSNEAGGAFRRTNSRPSLESIGLVSNSRGTHSSTTESFDSVSPSARIAAAWRRPSNETAKASGLTQAQAQALPRPQTSPDDYQRRDTSFEEPRRAPIPPRGITSSSSSSRPGTGNSVSSFGKTPGWGAAALASQTSQARPSTAGSTTSAVLPSATTRTLVSSSIDPRAPWPENPPPQFAPPPPPAGVEPHRPSTSSSFSHSQSQGSSIKVGTPAQLGRFSFEEKWDLLGDGSQPKGKEGDRRPASASHVESASGWPGRIPSLSIGGLGAGLGLSIEDEGKSKESRDTAALDQSRDLRRTPPRKFGSVPTKEVGSAPSPISRGSGGVGGGAGFAASTGRGRALAASMSRSRASQSVDDLVGDKSRSASQFASEDSIYSSRYPSSSRTSVDQPRLSSSSSSAAIRKSFLVSPSSSSLSAGSTNVTVPPPFLPGAFARDRDRDGSRERSGSVSSQSRPNGQRSELPYSKANGLESVEDLQDSNLSGRMNRRRSAGIPAINSNLSASSHGQNHSNFSASGHSNLSASGHGHDRHSREGSFDSTSGENGPTSPGGRERFLSLSSARTGSSSNLHASPASGSGHWGGYKHSNHSANSAVSSLHMQAGIQSVDQSRSPQSSSRLSAANSLSARNEAPRRPSTGGSEFIHSSSSRNGSNPSNHPNAPRSPSGSSYGGFNSHSRPTTPNSQHVAYGNRIVSTLREEDIEYEEIRENPEPSSLYGIRRRLVSTFSTLGSKHSGSSRPLSALRGPGGSSRTSLDPNADNQADWEQGRKGQVLMDEKAVRKAEEKLEQREKNLTIEALSKQEVATVTISVYTEQREGRWVTRGPATRMVPPQDELPAVGDPWQTPIDSKGIVARKKLKSNVELTSTRTTIRCSECASARQFQPEIHCYQCSGTGAVEVVWVVTVTLRLATFLPLKLPAAHLLGTRQPHLRYLDITDSEHRDQVLRDRAIDGAQTAAARVGRQHAVLHGARLLMAIARVERKIVLSVAVTNSKTKSRRVFDVVDGPEGKVTETTISKAKAKPGPGTMASDYKSEARPDSIDDVNSSSPKLKFFKRPSREGPTPSGFSTPTPSGISNQDALLEGTNQGYSTPPKEKGKKKLLTLFR